MVWYQPIVSTIRVALGSDAYTHIFLILPISMPLIFSERNALHSGKKVEQLKSGLVLQCSGVLFRPRTVTRMTQSV
jgi:hypothetical protein